MTRVRMDKWLWAARFFKTRALAARACELGRIECNGQGQGFARGPRRRPVACEERRRRLPSRGPASQRNTRPGGGCANALPRNRSEPGVAAKASRRAQSDAAFRSARAKANHRNAIAANSSGCGADDQGTEEYSAPSVIANQAIPNRRESSQTGTFVGSYFNPQSLFLSLVDVLSPMSNRLPVELSRFVLSRLP